jgi:hypothetical protein
VKFCVDVGVGDDFFEHPGAENGVLGVHYGFSQQSVVALHGAEKARVVREGGATVVEEKELLKPLGVAEGLGNLLEGLNVFAEVTAEAIQSCCDGMP